MDSREASKRCRNNSKIYVSAVGFAPRRYNKQKKSWEGYNGKDWESVNRSPDTSTSSTYWQPVKLPT